MIEAQVSRRDVLKFSALGAAAVALPLERAVRAKTREPDRGQQAAGALHAAVRGAAGDRRARRRRRHAASRSPEGRRSSPGSRPRSSATPCPDRAPTTPGPTIHASAARRSTVMQANKLPVGAPVAQLRPVDLDAPARVGVAAAVRRLRQRHHRSRASTRTTTTRTARTPGRSGTTTTACTTPPRTPTWAWPRSTTCTTTLEQAARARSRSGDVRRAADRSRDAMFATNGEL